MTQAFQPHDNSTILEGQLEDFPLGDILQVLQVSGKSGAVFLTRDDSATGIVVFRNGQIVQALTSESHQTLGERLVQAGEVSPVKLHEALGHLARYPGMRLGDALVDLGFTTRRRVEGVVKEQMAQAIEQMMSWEDTQFVFRVGVVSLGRGVPDFTADLVLDEGVEPRHLLLEASLLQDKRHLEVERSRRAIEVNGPAQADARSLASGRVEEARDSTVRPGAEAGTVQPARWFDPSSVAGPDPAETDRARSAVTFLSLTEELFAAQGRGEMGLLLLRYASELYSDGGLVMRDKDAFRLLGQFGSGIGCVPERDAAPKTHYSPGESPLFDLIVQDGKAYTGLVEPTSRGGLAPTATDAPGAIPVLAVPLSVLGTVSLILVCQTPLGKEPEARALLVLARQVAVTLENLTLREVARRMLA
ncbi:MAG: DUF4388 domain-containing protein [Holophagales bacterium]|nr:DUF4388 domain-containing protein [Holophagales bacterium]MBK9963690.1 DUF4388 domain-containing protein [Holophagales bacterium]